MGKEKIEGNREISGKKSISEQLEESKLKKEEEFNSSIANVWTVEKQAQNIKAVAMCGIH